MNEKCKTEGHQELICILEYDNEPYLIFKCKKCGHRQRMTIDRFNELMQFEMDNWDVIENDLNVMSNF